MRKTAVFVEGQTEKIFVREILVRYYEWNPLKVQIICQKLVDTFKAESVRQDFPDEPDFRTENFYLILDVGGDKVLASRIISREENLIKQGYTRCSSF